MSDTKIKGVIKFTPDFYKKLVVLKKNIESYFLASHKVIKLTGDNTNRIKCEINFGRHIIHFIEHAEKVQDFNSSICLSIEELESYGKLNKEIKLIIQDKTCYIYVNDITIPLTKQTEQPEQIDLPHFKHNSLKEETYNNLVKLFKMMYQKEGLLTCQEKIYEKITDSLYQLQVNDTDLSFDLGYKDLNLLTSLLEDDGAISFVSAPRWYIVSSVNFTIYVMKYKPDPMDRGVLARRNNLTKALVINVVQLNTEDINRIFTALCVQKSKVFALAIGKECLVGSALGTGYKIEAKVTYSVTKQEFMLTKKELTILLKAYKGGTLSIVTGRDFMIINKRFFVILRNNII